jgi:O-antigen/teichoic acid export membrane protein
MADAGANRVLRRVREGVSLNLGTTLFARGAAFISNIILARMLAPADFGLISLGLLAFQPVLIVTDSALPQAFLQSRADARRAAGTTSVLVPIAGLVLCVAVVLAAPLLASFFNEPALAPVVMALGLAYVLHAVGRVPAAVLEKRLAYRERAVPELVGPLAQAAVSVGLAVASGGRLGVWALAWGYVAQWAAWATTAWVLADWRPSWEFDRRVAREMLGYARDIIGVGVLVMLIRNLDNAAIGRLQGAEELGVYALAFNLSQVPATVVSTTVSRTLFPAFAQLQGQVEALREVHRQTAKIVAVLVFPLAAGLAVAAPDFVPAAYGEQWLQAVVPTQILAVNGLLAVLIALNTTLLASIGYRQRVYPGTLAMLAIVVVFLYPAGRAGIGAVALLFTLASAVGLAISEVIASRAMHHSFREQIAPLARPALAATIAALVAAWSMHQLFGPLGLAQQVLLALTMAALYIAALLLLDRDALLAVLQLSRRKRRSVE